MHEPPDIWFLIRIFVCDVLSLEFGYNLAAATGSHGIHELGVHSFFTVMNINIMFIWILTCNMLQVLF